MTTPSKRVLKYTLFPLIFIICTLSKSIQNTETPADHLVTLADGFLISRALYVAVELNIADALIDGPQSADVLAKKLNLNPDALFRLLRMLAAHGIFMQNEDGTFALNELSHLMTTTHPQTLHGFLLHEDEARWQAYGNMAYTIKTGKPTFNHLFGQNYFDYISHDKKRSEQFDHGMATFSEAENKQIAVTFDFTQFHHIVDIGGGVGGFLTEIVQRNPSIHTTLYELPHLETMARDYIKNHMMIDRISIALGSFFDSIVIGGDLYILKRILHDWSDAECTTILSNCRKAMSDTTQLLILDCIVPEDQSCDISKDIDIIMMVIFGGKERTKKDFETLFETVGLKLEKISYIPGSMLSGIWVSKK